MFPFTKGSKADLGKISAGIALINGIRKTFYTGHDRAFFVLPSLTLVLRPVLRNKESQRMLGIHVVTQSIGQLRQTTESSPPQANLAGDSGRQLKRLSSLFLVYNFIDLILIRCYLFSMGFVLTRS